MAHVTDITSADDGIVRQDKTKGGDAVLVMESIEKDLVKVPSLPSNCSIYRVPKPLFKTKPEAYIPRMVSIGPFHHHKEHLKPMEAQKLQYLKLFQSRPESQATLEDYVKDLIELENRARECYSEIVQLNQCEFVKMMIIDGCFILELILRNAEERDDPLLNAKWMFHVIKCDLILLENQLPFFVLECLYARFTAGTSNSIRLDALMSGFFQYVVPQVQQPKDGNGKAKKTPDLSVVRRSSSKKDKEDLVQPLIGKAEEQYAETPDLAVLEEIEEKFGPSSRIAEEGPRLTIAVRPSLRMAEEGPGRTVGVRPSLRMAEEGPSMRMAEEGHGVAALRPSLMMAEERPIRTTAVRPSMRMEEERRSRGIIKGEKPEEKSSLAKHLLDIIQHSLLQSFSKEPEPEKEKDSKANALVDFIHLLLPSSSKKLKPENGGKHVYTRCATELKEANVKFEKETEKKSLLDITFNKRNGVLKIPTIKIQDGTEYLLRNLIAYEQYGHDMCITDYAFFMDGLINSDKDVELLEEKGIIERLLGEPKEVATLFNGLLKDVIAESKYHFSGVHDDLEEYYRIPCHRWRASLMLNYFNSPWASIACIAGLILFIIAVVQLIFSILSFTT